MLGNLAFMQGTLFININKLLFRQRSLENTCLIFLNILKNFNSQNYAILKWPNPSSPKTGRSGPQRSSVEPGPDSPAL